MSENYFVIHELLTSIFSKKSLSFLQITMHSRLHYSTDFTYIAIHILK